MAMDKQEIIKFLAQEFPQALQKSTIEEISAKGAQLLYRVDAGDLRPGQTVSGPTLMLIADYVLYIAICFPNDVHVMYKKSKKLQPNRLDLKAHVIPANN